MKSELKSELDLELAAACKEITHTECLKGVRERARGLKQAWSFGSGERERERWRSRTEIAEFLDEFVFLCGEEADGVDLCELGDDLNGRVHQFDGAVEEDGVSINHPRLLSLRLILLAEYHERQSLVDAGPFQVIDFGRGAL